jgi:predicted metal-dependent hydrolase
MVQRGLSPADYQLIRSRRKTLSVEVGRRGVLVRAPLHASDAEIRSFVDGHEGWIRKHVEEYEKKIRETEIRPADRLSTRDLHDLAEQALKIIPERVAYYAPKVGVTYGRITIRNQKTRWGSCSACGNLNFNCLLMLAPPQVLDSVIVHELCHRKEMNHSRRFYDEVLRVFPDYWKWHGWLKENGPGLLRRMTG